MNQFELYTSKGVNDLWQKALEKEGTNTRLE